MGLKMREKQSVIREYANRYQRSNKKNKSLLLNEFIKLTGYNLLLFTLTGTKFKNSDQYRMLIFGGIGI